MPTFIVWYVIFRIIDLSALIGQTNHIKHSQLYVRFVLPHKEALNPSYYIYL